MGCSRREGWASHEKHRARRIRSARVDRDESMGVGSCGDVFNARQDATSACRGRGLVRNPIGGAAMRMAGANDARVPQAPPRVNADTPKEVYLWR